MALVSGRDNPKNFYRHLKNNTRPYTTAPREVSKTDKPSGPSIQQSTVKKVRKITEIRGSFLSRAELQSLVGTELMNLENFALRVAMMERIEETLTEVFDLRFLDAQTGLKYAFFCFTEITDWKKNKKYFVQDGDTIEPKALVVFSSTSSEDASTTRCEHFYCQLGKTQVVNIHKHKMEKTKKLLCFPTQSEVDLECTFS